MVRVQLIGAWIALASFWSVLSLLRHHAGETAAFDLGIFQQTLWNLTHGAGYVSSLKGEISLWADHQSPVLWLFAPFFALIPRSETLLVLQAWCVAAGIIPLALWAERVSKRTSITLIAVALYVLSQPIRSAVLFDFHPEILFLPLGFAWLEAITAKRPFWWVWFGLWLMTKETAALSGLAVGTLLLWEQRNTTDRRTALGMLAASATWLGACLWVIPALAGSKNHAYQALYSHWGRNWGEMALAPILHPVRLIRHFLVPERIAFLWKLSASVGFAHLLSLRAARWSAVAGIAALPVLLAGDTHRVNPHYHYGIEPSFALLVALVFGLQALSKTQFRSALWVIGLVAILRGGSLHLPQALRWWQQAHEPLRTAVFHRDLPYLQNAIAQDRTLAVPERWAPRLASRKHLYLLNQVSEFQPDCVLTARHSAQADQPERAAPHSGYTPELQHTHWILWRRAGAPVCATGHESPIDALKPSA